MNKLISLLILLNYNIFAADFDAELYRQSFAKMSLKEAYLIHEQRTVSDEYKAAAYHLIIKAARTEKDRNFIADLIFNTEDNVTELQVKYPASLDLISMRLHYAYLGQKMHHVDLMGMIRPIIAEADLFNVKSDLVNEIKSTYYNTFFFMILNYELKLKTKDAKFFNRKQFLFDPATKIPTQKDIAMWKSLVINYAKVAADTKKWSGRIKQTEAIAPNIKPLSKKEAYLYAGELLQPQLQRLFEAPEE